MLTGEQHAALLFTRHQDAVGGQVAREQSEQAYNIRTQEL